MWLGGGIITHKRFFFFFKYIQIKYVLNMYVTPIDDAKVDDAISFFFWKVCATVSDQRSTWHCDIRDILAI
jgi:hypothetical protein